MNNKLYCIANWKMNMTIESAEAFIRELKNLPLHNKSELVICTDFVSLSSVVFAADGTIIRVGAQNVHFEKNGAFTGEISTDMLVKSGAEFVIIGHSERRHIFHETNNMFNKKITATLSADLIPIFCVGEKLEDRKQSRTGEVLASQIKQGLAGLSESACDKIIIAYEPVWAIGTGLTASIHQVEEAHAIIRTVLESNGFDGKNSSVLYGGSVNPGNAGELLNIHGVNGFLIGGASLKVLDFFAIYQNFNKEIN